VEGRALTDSWISDETQPKEADFRGLLQMHARICKGTISRWSQRPYLYVDLYAGPGELEYGGHRFDGSPIIARDILTTEVDGRYEAVHFERDPAVAARLAETLWVQTSLLDTVDAEQSPIIIGRFQDEFPRWLDTQGQQSDRYGLIYADPIKDPIPHELLNLAAVAMPKVDLLSYVSATQYKRRRGGDINRNGHSDLPLLSDHIRAVKKKYALVRRPRHRWQFTFVLWTDWGDFPEWTQRGFHALDSAAGQEILDRLDLSHKQRFDKVNRPLPFEETE